MSRRAESGDFLPGAFDPSYTRPTTIFRSTREGELSSADGQRPRPEHAHPPLSMMLVLTQLAVGGFTLEWIAQLAGRSDGVCGPLFPRVCLGLGFLGLGASLTHLGRPQFAYRAILGIRHSWLSREIVTLGLFAKLAAAYVAVDVVSPSIFDGLSVLRSAILASVVVSGMLGVASSVMVYHVVRRPFWGASIAGWKFTGTALLLGLSTALTCLTISRAASIPNPEPGEDILRVVAASVAIVSSSKLIFEARDFAGRRDFSPLGSTAWLLMGPLKRMVIIRYTIGIAGGIVLPWMGVVLAFSEHPIFNASLAILALLMTTGGEFLERTLFFTAASKPRMPGGLPS